METDSLEEEVHALKLRRCIEVLVDDCFGRLCPHIDRFSLLQRVRIECKLKRIKSYQEGSHCALQHLRNSEWCITQGSAWALLRSSQRMRLQLS